jgi:thiol-disulfide isomerase/thioredoxin
VSRLPATAARRSRATSLALFALALLALRGDAPLRGQEGWQLPGLSGAALSSGDVASGVTVMVVWAGWSPRCRDIVERSNALVDRWGGQARIAMVDFQEERADVDSFLSGKGARAPVYLDGDGAFAKQHRVTTLPGLVVYRDGAVAYQGKLPPAPDDLLADLLR